ncbi:hypothetical protein [Ancrocorticia populi]|uniref:HEAT repeat domain-containing protein n=1 Tax=Ancrocorticia populi TaxID=2175228 RepID=A0A2V1K8V2_9ACTO|nr:hypothetical protein [Ancrocorticia populi]MDN6487452.1 hypothetical protein [Ancrocorticia sp.]PWF25845.1 hypothetical protein DD236_10470 [Ancrocorticia populi]
MAFLDIVQRLLKNSPTSDSRAQRAEELRQRLSENPNDVMAFEELAQIVRDAEENKEAADPLTADVTGTIDVTADLAMWALAEEIGASPDAWYPLVELARLSVDSDRESALRRLTVASDRETSGRALAAGIRVLREAGLPSAALGLGLGRWRPEDQEFEAGEQIVRAALEAGRVGEARTFLAQLPEEGHAEQIRALRSAIDIAEEL